MMFGFLNNDTPWFAQKSFGYGAGPPIVWQGWALLAAHVAVMLGLGLLLRDQPVALVGAVLTAAFLPMPLYAARTAGGWAWRTGRGK